VFLFLLFFFSSFPPFFFFLFSRDLIEPSTTLGTCLRTLGYGCRLHPLTGARFTPLCVSYAAVFNRFGASASFALPPKRFLRRVQATQPPLFVRQISPFPFCFLCGRIVRLRCSRAIPSLPVPRFLPENCPFSGTPLQWSPCRRFLICLFQQKLFLFSHPPDPLPFCTPELFLSPLMLPFFFFFFATASPLA